MKLNVVSSTQPWFAEGLNFTCSQCGNCCTGAPGYVYLTREELRRLAEFLKLSIPETMEKYCRRVGSRISLKEKRGPGGWDCIFLKEIQATSRPDGADQDITYTKRVCTVYYVRPLQCRTWPFWDGNLASRAAWEHASKRCPGIDQGDRHFTRQQIEALRDATDWPERPPTSGE